MVESNFSTSKPSSSTSSPLGDDLQEMAALGGFMFLINEMRDLAQGRRVKDTDYDDVDGQREKNRQTFEQIMTFPRTLLTSKRCY